MVKNILYSVIFLFIGTFLGWIGHCTYSTKESPVETNVVRTDTVVREVFVKVPVPKQEYVYLTDTIEKMHLDSVFIDIIHRVEDDNLVPTNVYCDSIMDSNFKLNYEIQTIGELLSFKPKVSVFQKTIIETRPIKIKPKWTISSAISNKGNFKVGLGYKGWVVETELKDNFNQIFFGYQYQF